MKRLLLSLLGGFGLPLLYAVIVGPLSVYIKSERINHLLWIPIGWPQILCFYLSPMSYSSPSLPDNAIFAIQIVCDVALYGSLTYIILLARSLRKRKTYTEPPPPPVFGRAE
jgi:hypothetical protein